MQALSPAIPLTPQTDPSKFAKYSFHEYPKVVGYLKDGPDGKNGTPIIAEDEKHMLALIEQGKIEKPVERPVDASPEAVAELRRQNDALLERLALLERKGEASPAAPGAITVPTKPVAKVVAEPQEEKEKKNLQKMCKDLDIKFTKNWTVEQLRTAIENA